MIKNRTYYKGRPKLKLEKSPYYQSGGKKGTVLNKVHLDLKFIKLVSRICVEKKNISLLKEIAKSYDAEYKEYDIDPATGACIFYDTENKHTPCIVKDDTWMSLDELWMCYKHGWKLIDHGLAEIWEKGELVGYYGYSHRGGNSFRIGDKLFDRNWKMNEFHPDFKKYKKKLNRSRYSTRIEEVIPFKERGSIEITSLAQAKEAAQKMSAELS